MSTSEIHTEIEIDASPEAVWSVLTDTRRYPDWNPFVRHLSGDLREGSRLTAQIAPPGGRAMTLKPQVRCCAPARELRWRGRLLLPGLFEGEHAFVIEPLENGRTRFIQRERFRGVLVRFVARTLERTAIGFEHMNSALKREVETASLVPA